MEFLKERCYTAVNADELKVGCKIIVASNLAMLKDCVAAMCNVAELIEIKDEKNPTRLWVKTRSGDIIGSDFAYLVTEEELKADRDTGMRMCDYGGYD